MQNKSTRASSLWAHWDLDVGRKGGVYMLHARCKTNSTSHVVKEMLLTNACYCGLLNWTGASEKKCGAITSSTLMSATNVVWSGPLRLKSSPYLTRLFQSVRSRSVLSPPRLDVKGGPPSLRSADVSISLPSAP